MDIPLQEWYQIQAQLIQAFVERRGIHEDEFEAYNSYLPKVLDMFKEHVKVQYVDRYDRLHTIVVKDAYFIRPLERGIGFDDPERALLRSSYQGEIRGTMVYTIAEKPDADIALMDPPALEVDENEDDSEEEEEDEEEEEEQDDEEEEDEEEDESESKQPVFFFHREDYSSYSVIKHEAVTHNFVIIEDYPVWIRSMLCTMRMPWCNPQLYTHPYLVGAAYMVARNFKLCPYEEYAVNNRPLAQKVDKVEIRCKFYHISKYGRTNSTLKFTYEQSQFRKHQKKSVEQGQKSEQPPRFLVEIPHEKPKRKVPVIVLAMAFGWEVSEFIDAIRMYLLDEESDVVHMFLRMIAHDTEGCQTQTDALRRISQCLAKCRTMVDWSDISSYVSYTLRGEFLPNLIQFEHATQTNYDAENLRKGCALAEATAELIRLSGLYNENRSEEEKWRTQDKNSYTEKRTDSPGEKIVILTRKYVKYYSKRAGTSLKKMLDANQRFDLSQLFNAKLNKLSQSVKNGSWDSKSDASDHNQHKTQLMTLGFGSDSIHMQVAKIIKNSSKKVSDPKPLLTHPTQVGRIDLYVTPESDKCGIIRHKAPTAVITPHMDHAEVNRQIHRLLQRHQSTWGWIPIHHKVFPKHNTMVHDVYGGLIGWIRDPQALYRSMVQYRRQLVVHAYVSFWWDQKRNIFYFNVDEGRLLRPLIVVENLPRLLDCVRQPLFGFWLHPVTELLQCGAIEYLDASEEYCGAILTAETLEVLQEDASLYTHLEISALFAMSVTDSKPFINMNAGPRRMYTGNMEKRALSLKFHPDRGTTAYFSLWNGQKPLLSDPYEQALHLRNKEPNGVHVRMSVYADAGNIEDCLVFKKELFDRGAGCSSEIQVMTSVLSTGQSFRRPDAKCKGRATDDKYEALNEDGFPMVGKTLTGGGAVTGKVFEHKKGNQVSKRCVSRFVPKGAQYKVQSVDKYPDEKHARVVRVELRKENLPTIGDKFYFAHGQKGTAGRIVPQVDLPWISEGPLAGIVPDVFISPFSLFRITQGLLTELYLSHGRAISPSLIAQYETVFLSKAQLQHKINVAKNIFRRLGLTENGKSKFRSGKTGNEIMCDIFSGLVYMRSLKQLARDKLRSRERGPVNDLTRQPTVGKKSLGGLRIGEMEGWALHSLGMSCFLRNTQFECSTRIQIYWCTRCETRALGCQETGFYVCHACNRTDCLVRLRMPYIAVLTSDEMATAGFASKYQVRRGNDQSLDSIVDEERLYAEMRHLADDDENDDA